MTICKVCSSPERADVDDALTRGETRRSLASRFPFSESGLRRHATRHVDARLRQVAAERGDLNARTMLSRYADLVHAAEATRLEATRRGDLKTVLKAISAEAKILDQLSGRLGLTDLRIVSWRREVEHLMAGLAALVDSHPGAVAELAATLGQQGHGGPESVAAALRQRLAYADTQRAIPAPPSTPNLRTA